MAVATRPRFKLNRDEEVLVGDLVKEHSGRQEEWFIEKLAVVSGAASFGMHHRVLHPAAHTHIEPQPQSAPDASFEEFIDRCRVALCG